MTVGLVLFALFFLAFPFYRWYEPSGRADAREQHRADLAAQGAELYAVNCSACRMIASGSLWHSNMNAILAILPGALLQLGGLFALDSPNEG